MRVDDEVVVAPAEIGEECEGGAWLAALHGAAEVLSIEGDGGRDGGVARDGAGEGGVDEPVDVCGWEGGFEARGDGDGAADVAQGAGPNEENASRIGQLGATPGVVFLQNVCRDLAEMSQ